MAGVANLEKGVDHGVLPLGLKYYVEVYPRPVGWVT